MIKISHYNILLVDDEFFLRQGMKRKIEELENGFVVTDEASNGQETLDILQEKNIHLVITDIRMPVMDGLELTKHTQALYPDLPIVILSGYADFEYAQQALRNNVFDYLLKPVKTEELENTLEHVRLLLRKTYELPEDSALEKHSSEGNVNTIVAYMHEHYMEDIDIGQLSESYGFTSAYLAKLFNRYVGESPLKHLTNIRIHEAKRLLLDPSLSINRVGKLVGYPDQFHFSKTFRKITGMNPSAYRKQEEKS